jgi:hypothetical protein
MGELPSPTTEIVCELLLYLSGAAAASTSPVTLPRVKCTPLLHQIGKVEVSKSGYLSTMYLSIHRYLKLYFNSDPAARGTVFSYRCC